MASTRRITRKVRLSLYRRLEGARYDWSGGRGRYSRSSGGAETNRPVSLQQMKITRRPDSSQEISKKPVAKPPELVKAAAPGAE